MQKKRNRQVSRLKPRLTYAEQALFDVLEKVNKREKGEYILVAGNRSGILPLEVKKLMPEAELRIHAFDRYYAHAIKKRFLDAEIETEGMILCTPSVMMEEVEEGKGLYSLAFFMSTPRMMSAELVLDQLEDIHESLVVGGEFYAAFEGDADDSLKVLKKVWKSVNVLFRNKHVALFRMKKTEPLKERRDFSAEWTASVPGGEELTFTSFPGCFCHRRADVGGLALAEVASTIVKKDSVVLDMGCGSGIVGVLIADAQRRMGNENPETIFIDSHARAIAAAEMNAKRAGLNNCRFLLRDDGIPRGEKEVADLFVGNPPYYSDYRIAEVFLETAYRALRPGGICLSVVKTASGLQSVQEKYFRKVEVIQRRGYCILKSVRQS
jgi:16S rRNA (guanine1207-N2)-methyltransferase